jgi:adenylate cyclase
LLLVALAPVVAQLIGSVFNIWYNLTQVRPLLTAGQYDTFCRAITAYNVLAYPAAAGLWVWMVLSLRSAYRGATLGKPTEERILVRARRRAINLPNWVVAFTGPAWALCIPVFLLSLLTSPEPLDPRVIIHLPISVTIAGLIGVSHAYFAVELVGRRLLYPVLFQNARPAETPGARPVSLAGRAVLCAVAAGVCPIVSLLLLLIAPASTEHHGPWFAISVGAVGIAFGLSTAYMLAHDVAEPIRQLRRAAGKVADGKFQTKVGLQRADELGELIDEFNDMVDGLRDKQRIMETFGRHVGRRAAQQILDRNPGLGGQEREITILFADLRNFTDRCSRCAPEHVVSILNQFFTEMVEIVERHGGMLNKFLGDGFMAMFGAAELEANHAERAVGAGRQMIRQLDDLNAQLASQGYEPLGIGVGIHTGPAIVGSIGSPQRMEYTAVGDTVNVASRVESLTKVVGEFLLMTEATRNAISDGIVVEQMPSQTVKGKSEPLVIYALRSSVQCSKACRAL